MSIEDFKLEILKATDESTWMQIETNADPVILQLITSFSDSAPQVLSGSFTWKTSPEGLEYWCDIYDKLLELKDQK
jgi:hypothetical protein